MLHYRSVVAHTRGAYDIQLQSIDLTQELGSALPNCIISQYVTDVSVVFHCSFYDLLVDIASY